jgi:phosphoglycolate phosphatase
MNPSLSSPLAVIFDLDGTLINSLKDIADSMNRVLHELGYQTHTYDAYRFFVGKGLRNLVVQTIPESERTEETITTLHQALLRDYEKHLLEKTTLYQGIPELLNALTEKGIPFSILSNKPDPFTQTICRSLFEKWQPTVILGAGGDIPRKPNPSGALFICRKLGIQPDQCVYVGDSNVDMETANAAGMYAVGVSWGFRSRKELQESGAATIIDRPSELIELLDTLAKGKN